MTIFEALRKDHEVQRDLADKLIQTEGDSDTRDSVFQNLKKQLTHHAAAEERCLYIPMIDHDMTQEKARHSIAEHHVIDEFIKTLEETDYSSPGWLIEAKKLQHKIHHHLDEEEQEVFQMAGKVLTETQKQKLADDYQQEMKHQKNID